MSSSDLSEMDITYPKYKNIYAELKKIVKEYCICYEYICKCKSGCLSFLREESVDGLIRNSIYNKYYEDELYKGTCVFCIIEYRQMEKLWSTFNEQYNIIKKYLKYPTKITSCLHFIQSGICIGGSIAETDDPKYNKNNPYNFIIICNVSWDCGWVTDTETILIEKDNIKQLLSKKSK